MGTARQPQFAVAVIMVLGEAFQRYTVLGTRRAHHLIDLQELLLSFIESSQRQQVVRQVEQRVALNLHVGSGQCSRGLHAACIPVQCLPMVLEFRVQPAHQVQGTREPGWSPTCSQVASTRSSSANAG